MTRPKVLQVPPLRELLRRLRKHAPLSAPVRLRQAPNLTCRGEPCVARMSYRFDRRRSRVVAYTIWVDPRASLGERWEWVIHEWAHGLDRGLRLYPKDCHDTRWGQHYARAFNASRMP